MRLLICGDRNWTSSETILQTLRQRPFNQARTIIHGAARGADRLAGEIAKARGKTIEVYPANWEFYGRAAGPIRNSQMLTEGRPDHVLAFHKDLEHSKGTKDMIQKAKAAGIPTTVITGTVEETER